MKKCCTYPGYSYLVGGCMDDVGDCVCCKSCSDRLVCGLQNSACLLCHTSACEFERGGRKIEEKFTR